MRPLRPALPRHQQEGWGVMARWFKCWSCGYVESVDGVTFPDGSVIYGSTVDFCNNCDMSRRWASDEECIDEIPEPKGGQAT